MSRYIKKPKRTFQTKPCQCCGKQFQYQHPITNAKYCSAECSHTALLDVRRRWNRKNYARIKAGGSCGIGRTVNCKQCDKEFVRKIQNESFCSDVCRTRRRSGQKADISKRYVMREAKQSYVKPPIATQRLEAKFDVDRALKRVGLA
jgi:hypothetical protein